MIKDYYEFQLFDVEELFYVLDILWNWIFFIINKIMF